MSIIAPAYAGEFEYITTVWIGIIVLHLECAYASFYEWSLRTKLKVHCAALSGWHTVKQQTQMHYFTKLSHSTVVLCI